MGKPTESEELFEKIFIEKDISFDKIIPYNQVKTPDYKINYEDTLSYWEIKETKINPREENILEQSESDSAELYQIDSTRIRKRLREACVQFEEYGVTEWPCVIIVYDTREFAVRDYFFFESIIQSSIVGSAEYMVDNDGSLTEVNRRNGMLSDKNYITGVGVIYKDTEKIKFYHNPFSTFSFTHTLSWTIDKFENHFHIVKSKDGLNWKKLSKFKELS